MKINIRWFSFLLLILFTLSACGPGLVPAQPETIADTGIPGTAPAAAKETPTVFVPPASSTPEATLTFTPLPPTATFTPTSIPSVESLKAKVIADLLSCRYGPGPEYLFLYPLNKDANIKLIGRTDANNWVMVDGKNKCWVNAKFIEIAGDPKSLEILYPDKYKLPVSSYPPTTGVIATRDKNDRNKVEVSWNDIPLRAGDEEDESMQHYIVEVWRCESGQIIFDPLATNELAVTFIDETGCDQPSHGRVFVQEKHGFAGPTEIPWPAQ